MIEKAMVTTECQCEDEFGTEIESCLGDCYEWMKDDVFGLLGEWRELNAIDEDDHILIECEAMGWNRASGYKWTRPNELDGALSLRGDFRIEWYLDGLTLTARRWSHDEPTGSGTFHFTHYKGCDRCGEPVKASIHAEELGMCLDCHTKYFDHEEN